MSNCIRQGSFYLSMVAKFCPRFGVHFTIFKLAVEVGVQTHMLAAINDIDDTTLFKLRDMVTDEVRQINGIINFESAVRYQRSEE